MDIRAGDKIFSALETFRIELPSWGFANTGTRFGKFIQPAAATTTEEKFSDAGQVHRFTGVCPTVALHVLWDFRDGINSVNELQGIGGDSMESCRARSIPTYFRIRYTSTDRSGNPDPEIRRTSSAAYAGQHRDRQRLNSRDISLWFADGSNYPGTANIRHRSDGSKRD